MGVSSVMSLMREGRSSDSGTFNMVPCFAGVSGVEDVIKTPSPSENGVDCIVLCEEDNVEKPNPCCS